MSLQLRITLKSDIAPGVGEGEAGGIDRELVYTAEGIPVITARRLKGCLREACQEVIEALQQASATFYPESWLESLFGKQGKASSAWLQLDNAYPEGALEFEEWLRWAAQINPDVFGGLAVQQLYTGLRAQTSVSRHSGGALPNTLRYSRVISRKNPYGNQQGQNQVFVANLHLIKPVVASDEAVQKSDLLELLAVSCAAFRHLGLARNRGLGEVEVALYEDGENLTATTINDKFKTKLEQS